MVQYFANVAEGMYCLSRTVSLAKKTPSTYGKQIERDWVCKAARNYGIYVKYIANRNANVISICFILGLQRFE